MRLDAERELAIVYVPSSRRPALAALWHLDATLAGLLRGGEPMIAQIKLAWWRDALEALDTVPPPAEPVLEAIARHALPLGLPGADLAPMTEGWAALLVPELGTEALKIYAAERGGRLFACSARVLGGAVDAFIESAGEGWALADLARHSRRPEDVEAALVAARTRLDDKQPRWSRPLRPLGMLAALAARDAAAGAEGLETAGAPRRMLRMLRHRLTGR